MDTIKVTYDGIVYVNGKKQRKFNNFDVALDYAQILVDNHVFMNKKVLFTYCGIRKYY